MTGLTDDEFDDDLDLEDEQPGEVSDYVRAASVAFRARMAGDSTLAAMLEAAADVAAAKTREAGLAREDRDGR